jgi:protein SCO1
VVTARKAAQYSFLYTWPIMKKSTIVLILIAALALGSGAWFYQFNASAPAVEFNTALQYPEARKVQPFALTVDGKTTLETKDLQGHYSVLFFGFTRCPDVCPLTLSALAQAFDKWPSSLHSIQPKAWFVSVDPERDGLKQAQDYVKFFDPEFGAATGSREELDALTKQLGVVFIKQANEGSAAEYTIDHSANLLLINPKGELIALVRPPFEALALRDDLLALVSADQ